MNVLSEQDKAYIAGFFDGEGCVGYYNTSKTSKSRPAYFHASVHLCNIDPRVIVWVAEITGIGAVTASKSMSKSRRTAFQWQVGKKADVLDFLNAIRPYLKVKDQQVDILLAHFAVEASYVQRQGSVTPELVASRQQVADVLQEMKWQVFSEGVETGQAEPSVH